MTYISQLENQQKRSVTESTELRETITSLWTKLEMDESERQAFLTKHSGSKPSVIAKVSQYMWVSSSVELLWSVDSHGINVLVLEVTVIMNHQLIYISAEKWSPKTAGIEITTYSEIHWRSQVCLLTSIMFVFQ